MEELLQIPRISAGDVAAISGLNEHCSPRDMIEKYLYQDCKELQRMDCLNFGIEFVTEEEEVLRLLQRVPLQSKQKLQSVFENIEKRVGVGSSSECDSILKTVDKELNKAEVAKTLRREEINVLKEAVRSGAYTGHGSCRETDVLEAYEELTGYSVHSRNERYLISPMSVTPKDPDAMFGPVQSSFMRYATKRELDKVQRKERRRKKEEFFDQLSLLITSEFADDVEQMTFESISNPPKELELPRPLLKMTSHCLIRPPSEGNGRPVDDQVLLVLLDLCGDVEQRSSARDVEPTQRAKRQRLEPNWHHPEEALYINCVSFSIELSTEDIEILKVSIAKQASQAPQVEIIWSSNDEVIDLTLDEDLQPSFGFTVCIKSRQRSSRHLPVFEWPNDYRNLPSFSTESNESFPDFYLIGIVDGISEQMDDRSHCASDWKPESIVIEVKCRLRALRRQQHPPFHDQIQLVTYLLMLGHRRGDLVEYHSADPSEQPTIQVTSIDLESAPYHHGDNWKAVVHPRLGQFVQALLQLRRDEALRSDWLLSDEQRQEALLKKLLPFV